jgi:tetratricopeptide (TPR) repeat protein
MTSPPAIAPDDELRAASAADSDRETAARLSERLRVRAPLTAEHVRAAEDLFARYPVPARDLLEGVLIGAATGHREGRRYDTAAELLGRAQAVAPASPRSPKALLGLWLETGDWAAAEGAARDVLARAPSDAEAVRGLAYALVRQDRSREAIDVLTASLDSRPDPETRALLERFRRDQGSEASLDEARLAHFHVRYDGEAHEDVGRGILRVLDRHYATLVRTFGHQPASPIPVILLSRESYYDATGAPVWSGGQYDGFDGRVRLPIGGLTASLTAELDDTLLHELTHAFVADLSRGLAPREVHEGLAQLMEGKRSQTLLGEEGLRALANGRLQGVGGFYVSALGLVEDLVGQRGQGGVNEVLRTMAETGSSDEAFRRVYGKGLQGLKRDWAARLRQRYGS